jgi:hypothetical protein
MVIRLAASWSRGSSVADGNRLVGILHGCLARRVAYQEQLAWPAGEPAA